MHPQVHTRNEDLYQLSYQTYMENWYNLLESETVESILIPLTLEECKFLLTYGEYAELFIEEFPEMTQKPVRKRLLQQLQQKVIPALAHFGNKAFFRLSSRSPKDSYGFSRSRGLVTSFQEVMSKFVDSERLIEDICMYFRQNQPAYLVFRKWCEINRWEEFRLFIFNKVIMGISQYYYDTYFPELVNNIEQYHQQLLTYFQAIKEKLPLNNCILDIVFIDQTSKILEINPLYELTDPCLFNWKEDSFTEFEFRYIKSPPEKEKDLGPDWFSQV